MKSNKYDSFSIMGLYQVCRISLDVIALLVLMVGVILTACGLFTPAWQIGELTELGEYHEYGLWMDCVKGWTRTAGPKDRDMCFYLPSVAYNYYFPPFSNEEGYSRYYTELQQQQTQEHQVQTWKLATLAFMSLCFGLGFIALFVGCCGTVYKCPAIAWAVLTAIATLCGVIAVTTFAVHTRYPQNRYVLMTFNTAMLPLGRSFYMALAGVLIEIIATILSIACAVMLCLQDSQFVTGRQNRLYSAKKNWSGAETGPNGLSQNGHVSIHSPFAPTGGSRQLQIEYVYGREGAISRNV